MTILLKYIKTFIPCFFIILQVQTLQAQIESDTFITFCFEDATGAKDTVYYVFDSEAQDMIDDPVLGEVPVQLDTSKFGVYLVTCLDKGFSGSPNDPLICINEINPDSSYFKLNIEPEFDEYVDCDQNIDKPIIGMYKPTFPIKCIYSCKNIKHNCGVMPYVFGGRNIIKPIGKDTLISDDNNWIDVLNIWGTKDSIYFDDPNLSLTTEWLFKSFWLYTMVGIEDQLMSTTLIDVFPSITQDKLYIHSEENYFNTNMTITNSFGQEVIRKDIDITKGERTIHFESLPSGIYFLQLSSDELSHTFKIIKTR